MPITIFNAPLTNVFQPSAPIMINGEKVVLDFDLLIANVAGGPALAGRVEWYPEYCHGSDNPNLPTARWFREVAEEDIGNGDVRMPAVVRRFSTNAADNPLPASATHYMFDVELKRTHFFARIQMRVAPAGANACQAAVYAEFGTAPSA